MLLAHNSTEATSMAHDEWRLLGYGMLTAFLMLVVLLPILRHNINFLRSTAEGMLGGIAFAIFLLSKYMEHRNKPR